MKDQLVGIKCFRSCITVFQRYRKFMLRCQSVFHRYYDMGGSLCHSGTHTVIIFHTLCHPSASMEKQKYRKGSSLCNPCLHGFFCGEIQAYRYFMISIIYPGIQLFQKNPGCIQLLKISQFSGRIHLYISIRKCV